MQDLTSTIVAKSDQLNAIDLMADDKIIKITKIVQTSSKEQPTTIHYEGEDGRPYKPSLTMRRVLISCLGKDGEKYIGNSLQLYRNPSITWGKEECGGIEISHCTGIDKPVSVVLQTGRNKRRKFTVNVLKISAPKPTGKSATEDELSNWEAKFSVAETKQDIDKLTEELSKIDYDKSSKDDIVVFYKLALTRIKDES